LIETQEDWQHARSVGAGLKAVFDAVPVAATANYDDFQKWQRATLDETHFDLSDQEVHSLETSFLPATAIDAWKECMKIKAGGLALAVDDVGANTATIHLYWVRPSAVVGTSEIPVTIADVTPSKRFQGGWPGALGHITSDGDWKLTYSRNSKEALVIDIDAFDARGHHTTATARIPADRQNNYRKESCTFDLRDKLLGVPHGSKWSLPPCTNLEPGKTVTVALNGASFKVDGPHGIWIELADYINSDSVYNDDSSVLKIPVHPGDSIRGDNDPHNWNFSHVVTVPWDGTVNVNIWVIRAQIFPGSQSSLSAVSGALSITPIP
jgi:hypothetical protein